MSNDGNPNRPGGPPAYPYPPPGYGAPPYAQPAPPYGAPMAGQPITQAPYPYGQPPNPYAPPPPPYGAMQPAPQQQYPGYPPQGQVIVVQNQINPPYGAYYPPYPYALPANALKKDTAILLACIGFFFGICGIQRFYLRETGLGVLYLLTGGVCFIGQVIDIVQLMSMSQYEFDRKYNFALPPR